MFHGGGKKRRQRKRNVLEPSTFYGENGAEKKRCERTVTFDTEKEEKTEVKELFTSIQCSTMITRTPPHDCENIETLFYFIYWTPYQLYSKMKGNGSNYQTQIQFDKQTALFNNENHISELIPESLRNS